MSTINYNPIAISYNSRNSTNLILCIIVLVAFVGVSALLITQTYQKIYHNENVQFLSMSNSMFYSLFDILNNFSIQHRETTTKDVSNNILNNISYNDKYAQLLKNTKTQAAQIFSQNLYNKNIDDAKDTNTYEKLKSTMTALSSITTRLTTLQDANITALETIYTGYQSKIASYVESLISMLTKINSQITTLSADTVYSPMVQSLKQIFSSIRTTLVNNTNNIKKMYSGFDASTIPRLTSSDADIIANSNTAPDILARSGYIN